MSNILSCLLSDSFLLCSSIVRLQQSCKVLNYAQFFICYLCTLHEKFCKVLHCDDAVFRPSCTHATFLLSAEIIFTFVSMNKGGHIVNTIQVLNWSSRPGQWAHDMIAGRYRWWKSDVSIQRCENGMAIPCQYIAHITIDF